MEQRLPFLLYAVAYNVIIVHAVVDVRNLSPLISARGTVESLCSLGRGAQDHTMRCCHRLHIGSNADANVMQFRFCDDCSAEPCCYNASTVLPLDWDNCARIRAVSPPI